jgi:hypothetical protein
LQQLQRDFRGEDILGFPYKTTRDIGMYGKSIGQQVRQLIASRTIYSISMIEILHYAAQLAIFVVDYWN